MENVILKAAKNKLRFKTQKGSLNTEQLFDLDIHTLNRVYVDIESKTKKGKGLMDTSPDYTNELRLKVIEEVFNVKQAQMKADEEKAQRQALKEKVLEAIQDKQVDELKGKSIKDLKELAEQL